MTEPIRVLFLCVHNSARSQIAEGLLRHIGGDRYEAHSAGSEPTSVVRPLAVRAMAEAGIDISAQRPKLQTLFLDYPLDYVITTCDEARESCPVFPRRVEQIHWRFDDPSAATGTEDEQLAVYGRVLREIEQRIRLFVGATEGRMRAAG
jgi:arsenate reductase